jgi:nucleoside-diphosphate-sugar epimerase
MRILITGGSGHIGSAVVSELVSAGHAVDALVRSERSAAVVDALGAHPRLGDLGDHDGLRAAVADVDAVVHLAFDNDAALAGDLAGAAAADLAVVRVFGDELAGTGKAFVGIGIGPTGDPAVDAVVDQNPRSAVAREIAGLTERGVRSVLVAIPPVVHSTRDRIGFLPTLIGIARRTGASGYVEEGANCWPAVHTLDLGRLFRLAVEQAPAGTQLYGAAEDDVTTRQIAGTIARRLDLPAAAVAADRVAEHFGPFALFMTLDFPRMSDPRTHELLGWHAEQPGLIEDLEAGHYFAAG